eukprot:scaffold2200_cov35-Attheya_sp.AAC.1
MTDPSDIQSSPPTTPNTSQPTTMHFEAAVPPLTEAEQMTALVTQMASITTMLAEMQTTQAETLEKHKLDISNQVKADVLRNTMDLETRVETIDAKVALVETDIQRHDLDIDEFDHFKEDIAPKVDQALA